MSLQHRVKAVILLLLAATLLAGCFKRLPDSEQPRNYPGVRAAFFAPDGESIYFTFTSPKINGLFRMDLDGRVTAWLSKWWINEPTVSPDGRTLAFAAHNRGDKGDLWAMDSDGSNLRQLTSDSDYDREPRFSHNGKRIFFLRYDSWGAFPTIDVPKDWDGDVFCLDLATGKTSQITDEKFGRVRDLFVFPDDRHILLTAPKFEKNGDLLWKISMRDARQRTPITPDLSQYTDDPLFRFGDKHGSLHIEDPILSRDGLYLLFAWEDSAHRWGNDPLAGDQIYLVNMQNMRAKRILDDKHWVSPVDISPDNQWILFKDSPEKSRFVDGVFLDGNLWMVRRDGSGLKNLTLDFRGVLDKPPAALR